MTSKRSALLFSHHPRTVSRSPSHRLRNVFSLTWVRVFRVVAVVMLLLLAGCGDDDHHEPEDDFIVSFPSDFEIFIRRSFGDPFDLLEVGVTPFVDPATGPIPYLLEVRGTAFRDGVELISPFEGVAPAALLDPLKEQVVDALIFCSCFVDYVVLRSPFLDVTITFD